jgi:hypothetical protein
MLIDNLYNGGILSNEIKYDLMHCGFLGEAKINIDFGETKEIKNIAKLDKVLSYNIEYKKYELNLVVDTHIKKVDKVYVINKNIICGETQKFYVYNFGWKKAKDLVISDKIFNVTEYITIEDFEIRYEDHILYDLTIEKNHNFFVLGNLVHNQISISETPTNTVSPTTTPSITPTITITPTPTITPSITPTITITRTITRSPTPTISITGSIEPTPSFTATPTKSLTPTPTKSIMPTASITPTVTNSISITPTRTPSISISPTRTITPSVSITPTSSIIQTITPTNTLTPTITPTISITPTITPTIPIKTLFQDCKNNSIKYRFSSIGLTFNVGEVYEVNGNGLHFFGQVIAYAEQGTLYSSNGIVFTGPHTVCPSFCLTNEYTLLDGFAGNYKSGGTYNSKIYYTGDTSGFVYYNNSEWCLSNSLGGDCIINGKSPCFSITPDFNSLIIYSGYCVTPTPTPSVINSINFDASFTCEVDISPTPSITRTITPSASLSITPSASIVYNGNINLLLSGYTPNLTVTPTRTPSITPTEPIQILGAVTFNMLENRFARNGGVKVLKNCNSGVYYYVSQDLIYNGQPILTGKVLKLNVQGNVICANYIRDNDNSSTNLFFDEIISVGDSCSTCVISPTPTISITSSVSVTPSQSIMPTPSLSSNLVFVFESCGVISPSIKKSQLVQTQPYAEMLNIGDVVKDFNLNCWVFLGYFNNSYIPSSDFISLTYNGNYFNNYESNIYINCQNCTNG